MSSNKNSIANRNDMVAVVIFGVLLVMFGFAVFTGAPYVPSQRRYIERALTLLYPLSNDDVLVDIGSGDGVVLRMAVALGAKRAVGYEINPILVLVTLFVSLNDRRVEVALADFWRTDLPFDTTVVYAFSVSRDLKRIRRKIQKHANKTGRHISLVLYGHRLPKMQPVRELDAYHLYEFSPLQ